MNKIRNGLSVALLSALLLAAPAVQAAPAKDRVDQLLEEELSDGITDSKQIPEQILEIDPQNGDAHGMLGCQLYFHHDYDGAMAEFKTGLKGKFRKVYWHRSSLNYLYHCYIQKKDYKTALTTALECLKIENSSDVLGDISLLYKKTGNDALAKEKSFHGPRLIV